MVHVVKFNKKASNAALCRLCCSTAAIQQSRYRKLFSVKAWQDDLPGRLSRLLDLPVSFSDGLSQAVCIVCIKKLESFEAFRSLARQSYQKQRYKEQLPSFPVSGSSSPVRPATKKMTKDTGGADASPFTAKSRPAAKRSNIGGRGKHLIFSPRQSRNK